MHLSYNKETTDEVYRVSPVFYYKKHCILQSGGPGSEETECDMIDPLKGRVLILPFMQGIVGKHICVPYGNSRP